MTFFGALYKLLIGPLELFFEVVFVMANKVIDNLGLSIIILSLVMNFLVLPLYKRADAMQEEQRETEKRLKKWVTHIKKTFKGDERFMMLQTYYRQNGYKPTSILKGSVSLLLEIPFFIAAYNFLSHAGVFEGFVFGPFSNMGQPDGLIKIGAISINLLPILMTAINIVSSAIYTKGLPTSSKIQLYGMAGIFFVLLYDSPAALVFYWTLNNLFSLLKNIFYKLKNPKFVLSVIASILGLVMLIFVIVHPFYSPKKQLGVIFIGILLQLPIAYYFLKKYIKVNKKEADLTKTDKVLFYTGALFLTLLTGLLIPSAVMKSSPEEFINSITYASPLKFILSSMLIAAGTFIVWFNIFYMLADNKGKRLMGLIIWLVAIVALVNYMFFGKDLGNLSPFLIYEKLPEWPAKKALFNLLILGIAVAVIFVVWYFKKDLLKVISVAVVVSVLGMGMFNCIKINSVAHSKSIDLQSQSKEKPVITLSKTGKNVMVLMMDRAIGAYIPYIFNEKPELAEHFSGFTYYPNTVSFGSHTNTGSPSLYGGYEYIPEEINKRDTELLVEKQNEALKVMPVLFDQNGFDVTVCDPSYAGYSWMPDLTIYDDYPDIKRYITLGNKEIGVDAAAYEENKAASLNRNFFVYSVMKTLPIMVQTLVYNKGQYCSLKVGNSQTCDDTHKAAGISDLFMKPYVVLQNMENLTQITSENNAFVMMSNDTTHEPCLLQEPEYEPREVVDNTEYDKAHMDRLTVNGITMNMNSTEQVAHYHANMAAMIELGKYFDFLKENGIYDNTRIIIVADHGRGLKQFDTMVFGEGYSDDAQFYNPLFMVKDFNSTDFTMDEKLMTNADTPTIAFKDLIENPINPFTKKEINNNHKNSEKLNIFFSLNWDTLKNNGTTFLPGTWYSVHDDVRVKENWERVE